MSNFLIVLHSQLLRGNVAEKQPQCDKRNLKEAKRKKMLSRFLLSSKHSTRFFMLTQLQKKKKKKSHTYMNFKLCLTAFLLR